MLFGQIEALRASHWQVGGRERACGRLGTSVRAAGNGMPGGRQCKRPVRLTGACTQAVRWLGMGCREAGNRMCLPAGGGGMVVCLSKTFSYFFTGCRARFQPPQEDYPRRFRGCMPRTAAVRASAADNAAGGGLRVRGDGAARMMAGGAREAQNWQLIPTGRPPPSLPPCLPACLPASLPPSLLSLLSERITTTLG